MTHLSWLRAARAAGCVAAAGALLLLSTGAAYAGQYGTYNGAAAARYADTYWSNYNIDYASFGGTDCTNFVSQALNSGPGNAEDYGKPWEPTYLQEPLYNYPSVVDNPGDLSYWYGELTGYGANYYSNTWTVAPDLFYFLTFYDGSSSYFTYSFDYYQNGTAPSIPPSNALGDPFFYNWDARDNGEGIYGIDHATITAYGGWGTDGTWGTEVDAHDSNRQHVFWTLRFVQNPSNPYWPTEEVFTDHVVS